MTEFSPANVTAVLGPTNTGKTHLAIERMSAHSSGMIGFPLRLLAREVYDRMVALKGANQVALVTGEEKIVPPDARWFLCTAEAMPRDRDFSFVAIDEAQLGINPERGHVFTDRILHARGRDETLILGSESLRPMINRLLPDTEIITRPRFSTLSYAGPRKLSRLPRRSAIVGFSVEDVYAIAEMLRRQKGGAAIVMGSLSPQTRNAQVKLYQDGEVDYLVATDAIGMGLNLDVAHVAFASLTKFDGRRRRRLTLAEIGQIAGRAGRHQKDGSFGMLSGLATADTLTPEEIEQLEAHEFPDLEWLYWRDADPDLHTVDSLIASLERPPQERLLAAAPEAVDLAILKRLAQDPDVRQSAIGPARVGLLWEAASIPDFRKVGADHQARFVASLWPYLAGGNGRIPHARMAQEIARLENVQGDIATLAARIAAARTWSYIAQKPHWVEQADNMVERTRELERQLSDAMHNQLTQRFVDKRTGVLMRGLRKDVPLQEIALEEDGAVLVEGIAIGSLKGFQFVVPSDSRREDRKILLAAAERYLGPIMTEKADMLAKAPDGELLLAADDAGRPSIFWQESRLATLGQGKTLLTPQISWDPAIKELSPDNSKKVEARVTQWVHAMQQKHLEGLVKIAALSAEAATPPGVRALFSQIVEAGGIISRRHVDRAVRELDNDLRAVARRAGLVFGALDIFHHALMKPGAVLWRTALFAALDDKPMIKLPDDNAVHLGDWKFASPEEASRLGFRKIGDEYLRVDMTERLIKQAHEARQEGAVFALSGDLATSLGLSAEGHKQLLEIAGFATAEAPVVENEALPATASETTGAAAEAQQEEQKAEDSPAGGEPSAAKAAEPQAEIKPETSVSYWQWVGMGRGKASRSKQRDGGKAKRGKGRQNRPQGRDKKPAPVLATGSGAFAELAALKESMKK